MSAAGAAQVVLQPPLPKGLGATTLNATFSPRANSLALYPAPSTSSSFTPTGNKHKLHLYTAALVSKVERRALVVESYTLFASLQTIARDIAAESAGALDDGPTPSQVQYYNRISRLYRQAVIKQLTAIEEDKSLSADARVEELTHHASLHAILSLSELLYLPADGRGDGVVGEEILDWLNTIDRAPSAAEGLEFADLSEPWIHPNFWPYIQRCVLRGHLLSAHALLSVVQTHPSAMLQRLVGPVLELLRSLPRSTAFRVEREYLDALGKWKARAGEALAQAKELWKGSQAEGLWGKSVSTGERKEWTEGFRWLFELFDGQQEAVLSTSEDWREALAAWGIWVKPSGRRENLPHTLNTILKHHPLDHTLSTEAVQVALIQNDVALALQQANLVSTWLVAHLADLFSKLAVLPTPDLRDYFVLSYCDILMADPGLWRIVVDYLVTVGSVGRARAIRVLESVDLVGSSEDAVSPETGHGNGEAVLPPRTKVVEDVLRVCAEHGMQEQTRSICKVYSEILIQQKRYGEAVAFCIRAGEPKRIARIADRVLDEYVIEGQESFIEHVDSIPTSLLRPLGRTKSVVDMEDDSDSELENAEDGPVAPHPRLSFLARYRDFFALYARGERREAAALLVLLLTSGIAPKRFYAVMFLDVIPLLEAPEMIISLEETYELLRCLEEITGPVASTGRDIYGHLTSLAIIVGTSETDEKAKTERALEQLTVVRAALATHLGRCFTA